MQKGVDSYQKDTLRVVSTQTLTQSPKMPNRQDGGMEAEGVTGLAASCTLVRVRRCQARDAGLVDRHRIRVCMGHMQHGQKRRTGREGARLRYYSSDR